MPTLDEIRHSLYEILQDPVVLEAQRKAIINDATLVNIQGTLKPTLDGHALNLWNGIQAVPTKVLSQTVQLSDGTVPNVAAVLDRVLTKTVPAAGAATAPFDIEAFVARLKAELPTAVVSALAAKLTAK